MTLFPDDIFNLADVALEIAEADPGRVAVIEPDGRHADGRRRYRPYTYRQLSRDVESVAIGLREIGIAERTRTVFMTPPSYGGCVVGLALTRMGATTVWIDPSVGWLNVAERLNRLRPDAFVGIPLAHLGRMTFGWGSRLRMKGISIGPALVPGTRSWQSLRRPVPAHGIVRANGKPQDPAAIMYTTRLHGPREADAVRAAEPVRDPPARAPDVAVRSARDASGRHAGVPGVLHGRPVGGRHDRHPADQLRAADAGEGGST